MERLPTLGVVNFGIDWGKEVPRMAAAPAPATACANFPHRPHGDILESCKHDTSLGLGAWNGRKQTPLLLSSLQSPDSFDPPSLHKRYVAHSDGLEMV